MLKRPDFQQSRESAIIRDLFLERSREDKPLVTWQEMIDATGRLRDIVRSRMGGCLAHMLSVHGQVWRARAGIGYYLVSDHEISEVVEGERKKAYKQAKRGVKKADCADLSKMTSAEQLKICINRAALEQQVHAGRPRTLNNLEQAFARKHNQMPSQEDMMKAIKESLSK